MPPNTPHITLPDTKYLGTQLPPTEPNQHPSRPSPNNTAPDPKEHPAQDKNTTPIPTNIAPNPYSSKLNRPTELTRKRNQLTHRSEATNALAKPANPQANGTFSGYEN
jgi:hypothetical protein